MALSKIFKKTSAPDELPDLAIDELKKDLKKDLKAEEKIDSEEYLDLKKAYKDLKAQLKDVEDRWEQDLLKDEQYVKLREMKVKKEEEMATALEKLFEMLSG